MGARIPPLPLAGLAAGLVAISTAPSCFCTAARRTVAIGKLKRLWLEHPTPDELGLDVIRLDHTLQIFHAIPGASLYIMPATEHATFRDDVPDSGGLRRRV